MLTAEQSASMNRAIHSGNTQASNEAFGAIASGVIDSLGAQDVNALVQQVLRDAYLQNTEDLRAYAEKVKHFNEQKAFFATISEPVRYSRRLENLRCPLGSVSSMTAVLGLKTKLLRWMSFSRQRLPTGSRLVAFTIAHNRGVDTCLAGLKTSSITPMERHCLWRSRRSSVMLSPLGILTKLSRLSRSLRATFRI